jgi:hypothetical protein
MRLRMRVHPRKVPSLRAALISLHLDLFAIDEKVIRWEGLPELSQFEKLVLVLEDRRFLKHDGFDPIAFAREIPRRCYFGNMAERVPLICSLFEPRRAFVKRL